MAVTLFVAGRCQGSDLGEQREPRAKAHRADSIGLRPLSARDGHASFWSCCALLSLLGVFAVGCRGVTAEKPGARHAELGQGRAVLMGSEAIATETIARVQAASGLDVDRALDEVLEVRALSQWARSGGLAGGRRRVIERSLLARAMLERIDVAAAKPGEPHDDEIARLTRERWVELDRPPAWRLAHALVLREGSSEEQAYALAQRIASAVRSLTDETAFLEAARAVPHGGHKVVVESLPPVTASGRTFYLDASGKPSQAGPNFDLDFAKAAASLRAVGSQSPIVRTTFGFHVLLLTGRVDGYTMPMAERRRLLAPEIMRRRAESELTRVVARLRSGTPPSIERAALELTSRVQVAE